MSNQQEQRGDGGSNALHTLTANASTLIANDEYCFGQDAVSVDIEATEQRLIYKTEEELLDLGERIVMQVVGLRRLKYSIIPCGAYDTEQCTSREDFQSDHPNRLSVRQSPGREDPFPLLQT